MIEYQSENEPIIMSNTSDYLTKTFFRMFLGLLATAFAAGYTYYSGFLDSIIESGAFLGLFIIEFIVVIAFSAGFRKFSSGVVTALFFAYAIINGITFSTLFAYFELSSIVYAFVGSAAIFGIMAFIGKNTKADLTRFGTILSVTLLVGCVVSIINLFLGNGLVDIVLDWVILLVFMGFTVYDMNNLKNLYNEGVLNEEKLYVYGAMELYLDFINIFLRILSIFGNVRRD